jgi:hypothetical protein
MSILGGTARRGSDGAKRMIWSANILMSVGSPARAFRTFGVIENGCLPVRAYA